MILRPYQSEAVGNIFREWKENTSTLAVLPTGAGKSLIFSEVINRMQPARAIVVAHRLELIHQARRTIEDHAGLPCEVEMADMSASTSLFHRTPVVIATVQTLISGAGVKRRYDRFSPGDFGLLVIDEFHHATADSYRAVINHFRQNPDLKVLGVTATPDRADEEALGQICDTVAFEYEILDAIRDGWLVPVEQQMVSIQGLDFSQIRTTAGDLNGADLAAVMEQEKNMQGVVGAAIAICDNKRTILFASSVRQAETACQIFNRHRPGMAGFVSGKTPKEDRTKILKSFSSGETQVLCNCGVATEGFDVPAAEVCIMARPTKSRSLYAQMAGRVTRPLPGVVDCIDINSFLGTTTIGTTMASARQWAISRSAKPSCLIVDFVGNSGRHKLMCAADVLGGKIRDEVVELAARKARERTGRSDVSALLDEAEEELAEAKRLAQIEAQRQRELAEAARKSRLVARVAYTKSSVDPFDVWSLAPVKERGWDIGHKLSEKQANVLRKQGIDPDSMSYSQAKQLLNEQFRRWDLKLCSLRQAAVLKRNGYENAHELTREQASKLLDALARNCWRRPDMAHMRAPVGV